MDGPNFNIRKEDVGQVLYAIRNGGFSGAIMPENIVVGKDAQDVAAFLSRYAGRGAKPVHRAAQARRGYEPAALARPCSTSGSSGATRTAVRAALARRGADARRAASTSVLELDARWREATRRAEALRAEQKARSEEIAAAKRAGEDASAALRSAMRGR